MKDFINNGYNTPNFILNGEHCSSHKIPKNAVYIGMEKEPNKISRYGKQYHKWFNLPCYITANEAT